MPPFRDVIMVAGDDQRDVSASLMGDGEAYARLVRRYQDAIARYLWRFTREPAMLDELVQDVFVEAYFSLGRFKNQAPLLTWLKAIATRVGYRFWKRRRQRFWGTLQPAELEKMRARPQRQLSPEEAAEWLHGVLSHLRPRDRLVLTLMYLEGLSVAEIARQTGWTRALVKVQAMRARGRLKKLLERLEERQ
ncbi:MAG: RNA polymerase sigma factor [Phycisphaerae bacterium]